MSRDYSCIFCRDTKKILCLACENAGAVGCARCSGTRKIECSMCRGKPKHQCRFTLTYKEEGHPPHMVISEIYAHCRECKAEMRQETIESLLNSGYSVDEDLWQRLERFLQPKENE